MDNRHRHIDEARAILRDRFGYDAFRPGQQELVDAVIEGRDVLGIMPTGAGKSICYQVPALSLPGLALVISPLVSLMHDQVRALVGNGIPAAYLNSQLTPLQQDEVLHRALGGTYKLMYIAPERLGDPRFNAFVQQAPISLVAVDEAHCVSQWGQDFRPSYLGIAAFIAILPQRPPVAAFTATATPRVAADIARLLELRKPTRIVTGFDRPNLHFEVHQLSDKRKLARIASYALDHEGDSGIVYCNTRKDVERLQEALVEAGVRATRYHAGLTPRERETNQRSFVNDDAPVMVATNAFGMGIDKSNVRYVIHHNMPGSLEAYYQEAGRAGRDGEPADCLLFWNDSDIATARFFIERESENEVLTREEAEAVRASQRRRLAAMTGYCMTTDCLRATILRYFGEEVSRFTDRDSANFPLATACEGEGAENRGEGPGTQQEDAGCREASTAHLPEGPHPHAQRSQTRAAEDDRRPAHSPSEGSGRFSNTPDTRQATCGNCSNCSGSVDAVDVTLAARAIMRCVHELRGRYGKGTVADVLRGSKSEKVRQFGLDRARTYGILDESSGTIKEITELLVAGEYLEVSEGRFPLVGLGPRAREAATDEFRLHMKRVRTSPGGGVALHGTPGSTVGSGSGSGAGGAPDSGTGSATNSASRAPRTPKIAAALETREQRQLFERLRTLRKRLADSEGVPPYVVFSDAALRGMCVALPQTDDEFLAVNGVGQAKLQRYGRIFMEEIAR